MKSIIKISLLVCLLLPCVHIDAQCKVHAMDPQINKVAYDKSEIDENENVFLAVDWSMQGADQTGILPSGSWIVQIALPSSATYGSAGVEDIHDGAGFNWSYDASTHTFNGVSSSANRWMDKGTISVRVKGNESRDRVTLGTQVNIFVVSKAFGGCPEAFQNNINNDQGVAKLTVRKSSPVVIKSMGIELVNCNQVNLYWASDKERNLQFIEVQRSDNGLNYENLVKMPAKGNAWEGASYTFTDGNIERSKHYHYRLNQILANGTSNVLAEQSLSTETCLSPSLELYPNPAYDKLYVTVMHTGPEAVVDLIITNMAGEQVLKVKGAAESRLHEINIEDLPAGVYDVRMGDIQNASVKRFIKIK